MQKGSCGMQMNKSFQIILIHLHAWSGTFYLLISIRPQFSASPTVKSPTVDMINDNRGHVCSCVFPSDSNPLIAFYKHAKRPVNELWEL